MSKLADIAKETFGAAQSIKIKDVIEKFGGTVTINGLSYTEYKNERIPVFSFAEGNGLVFWGGIKKLKELAANWVESAGDLRAVNDELAVEGVKIKIADTTIKTKSGNPFRPVTVLGSVKFDKPAVDTEEIVSEIDAPF